MNDGGIPLRRLGKTGEMVSLLCLGGHSCTNPKKLSEKESLRLIQRAVDEGIHFMDNCWDYHDGGAEERMGKALAEGGRRDKVFLMTKVCGRTAKEAQSNLEDSLRRLRTDRIDLWQFHEIGLRQRPRLGLRRRTARSRRGSRPSRTARSATSGSPGTRTRRST